MPFVRASLGIALLLGATACGGPARPNVVLVVVDTLRADAVGAYGGPLATPALDALAAEGVLFARAVAPAPETAPSHVTLFTGRAVQRHGVTRNGLPLPEDVPVLAEAFRDAGYDTAAFASSFILDARFGWSRGFRVYDATFPKEGETLRHRRGFWSRFEFEGFDRRAAATSAAALGWLARAREPFFLFVHYFDPHAPYAAEAEWVAQVPRAWARREARARAGALKRGYPRLPPGQLASILREYQAEVLAVDAAVGTLLAALEARGSGERTLVAVTADHGEGLGQHGTLDHAPNLYEEQLHVPLLLRLPGALPAGARVETPVGLVDLPPTLADLAGVAFEGPVDGRSLAGALRAGEEPGERPVIGRRRRYPKAFRGHRGTKFFVRSGRFKYIRASEDPDELYDLASDPGELHDLHGQRAEVAAELSALLDAHLAAHPPRDEAIEIPADVREGLEALGYAEP